MATNEVILTSPCNSCTNSTSNTVPFGSSSPFNSFILGANEGLLPFMSQAYTIFLYKHVHKEIGEFHHLDEMLWY